MLVVGQEIPDVAVWTAPHERSAIGDLIGEGQALFLFYLFDWSST